MPNQTLESEARRRTAWNNLAGPNLPYMTEAEELRAVDKWKDYDRTHSQPSNAGFITSAQGEPISLTAYQDIGSFGKVIESMSELTDVIQSMIQGSKFPIRCIVIKELGYDGTIMPYKDKLKKKSKKKKTKNVR